MTALAKMDILIQIQNAKNVMIYAKNVKMKVIIVLNVEKGTF